MIKNKLVSTLSIISLALIFLTILIQVNAKENEGLVFTEEEELYLTFDIVQYDEELIKELISQENYSSDLLHYAQMTTLETYLTILQDYTDNYYDYGYWEILVDYYLYEDVYYYECADNEEGCYEEAINYNENAKPHSSVAEPSVKISSGYQGSHKYFVYQDPYYFKSNWKGYNANQMTFMILPSNTQEFLNDLASHVNYDAELSEIYEVDGQYIHVDNRKTGHHDYFRYGYNDVGILNHYILYFDEEVALEYELSYYNSYEIWDPTRELLKSVMWMLIVLAIIMLITPLLIIIAFRYKRKGKDSKLFILWEKIKEKEKFFLIMFFFGLLFFPYVSSMVFLVAYYVDVPLMTFLAVGGGIIYLLLICLLLKKRIDNWKVDQKGVDETKGESFKYQENSGDKEEIELRKSRSYHQCSNCHTSILEDALFCPECGKPTRVNKRFCKYCGINIPSVADFCHNCGNKINEKSIMH